MLDTVSALPDERGAYRPVFIFLDYRDDGVYNVIDFRFIFAKRVAMFPHRDLQKPDYKRAEGSALKILRDAGLFEPPVDPVQIARSLNVQVQFARFQGESEGVSGFFDCDNNVIMVNKADSPLRQTFTVAHELGHKVLHEDWAKTEEYKVLWRDPTRQGRDRREQEADAFAANLLMPREMMDHYYTLPIEQLSRLFAVSVPAVRSRLSFLYGI